MVHARKRLEKTCHRDAVGKATATEREGFRDLDDQLRTPGPACTAFVSNALTESIFSANTTSVT